MNDSTKSQAGPAKKDAPVKSAESKEPFKREAFGGRSQRLNVPEEHKDPGYFYYWFRDEGDNCYRAKRAGYTQVSFSEVGRIPDRDGHDNDPCVAHGGVGEAGRPYKMVLMKLPKELRAEDVAAQAKLTDDVDDAIFRREFEENKYGSHNVQIKDEE
jgi:hypothetical protein